MVGRSFFKYSERFKVIFYAHNSSVWCPHGSVGFLRHNDIILALFVFFSCTCCLPLSWTWNVLIFKSTTVQKSSRDLFSFKKKEVAQMHDSIINFDWNLFFPCDVCFLNFLSRKSWRLKVEIIPILEHFHAKLEAGGVDFAGVFLEQKLLGHGSVMGVDGLKSQQRSILAFLNPAIVVAD